MRKRQEPFSFEDTSGGREEVVNFDNKCTERKDWNILSILIGRFRADCLNKRPSTFSKAFSAPRNTKIVCMSW